MKEMTIYDLDDILQLQNMTEEEAIQYLFAIKQFIRIPLCSSRGRKKSAEKRERRKVDTIVLL